MLNREPSENSREAAAQIEVGDGEDSKHEGGGENLCDAVPVPSPHHYITIYEARVTMSDTHPTRPGHLKNESAIFFES